MKPTVGRIVHFYTSQPQHQSGGKGIGPYAAIITSVHSDSCVDVAVFKAGLGGGTVSVTSVTDGLPTKDMQGNAWAWPPREEAPQPDAFDKWTEGLGEVKTVTISLEEAKDIEVLLNAHSRTQIPTKEARQRARELSEALLHAIVEHTG